MNRRLLVAALLTLLPVQMAAAQSVSQQIDAELLRQFPLKGQAVQKYYGTSQYVALCRHEQFLALSGKIYGYGACVLVYKSGTHAQTAMMGNHFRAIVADGKVTALESPGEGWPAEDVRRLFPWYVRGLIFGSQYAGAEGRIFNRAQAEAAQQLGLPLE